MRELQLKTPADWQTALFLIALREHGDYHYGYLLQLYTKPVTR